ncbi:hypothetical protein ACF3MZ_02315 [Paenibacillaceae bacterium WGS1546]|uniref:hypothetical protein n=1 Tax=Cohnella sp. WGS1546 TaxID=3366810 RepID=UPI00372D3510
MTSIFEFFRTGQLGHVGIRMSLADFESVVGKPQDVSVSKNPMIYKYGSFQFSFTKTPKGDYQLSSIHLYFGDDLILPDRLVLSDWDPDRNHENLIEYFQQSHVNLQIDQQHSISNLQVGYRTQGGVILIFAVEGRKNNLVSIHKY